MSESNDWIELSRDTEAVMVPAGHTVLLVSHEPYTIATFCQRAILIDGGRVALDDRADRVADEYLRRLAAPPATDAAPA